MCGGFEKSQEPKIRWELTGYRGVHWVEVFVINTRTNECMGKSDRFFVVVEEDQPGLLGQVNPACQTCPCQLF